MIMRIVNFQDMDSAPRAKFFRELHEKAELLLANYLLHNKDMIPEDVTLVEAMQWAEQQRSVAEAGAKGGKVSKRSE